MKNLLIFLVLGLSACAKPAPEKQCGFRQDVNGKNISWKGNVPVILKLDTSVPDLFIPEIVAAAEVWNKAAGRELIKIDTTKYFFGQQRQDRQNVIYALETWNDKPSEQGKTSVYNYGPQITEADIKINLNFAFFLSTDIFKSGIGIEALMVHELGHVLGLTHTDTARSTMSPYLYPGDDRIRISTEDAQNLSCQY